MARSIYRVEIPVEKMMTRANAQLLSHPFLGAEYPQLSIKHFRKYLFYVCVRKHNNRVVYVESPVDINP